MQERTSKEIFAKLAVARWGEGEAAEAYAKEQNLDFLRYAIEFSFDEEQVGLHERLQEIESEDELYDVADELHISEEKMKEGAAKAMVIIISSWNDFASDEKVDSEVREKVQKALEEIIKDTNN